MTVCGRYVAVVSRTSWLPGIPARTVTGARLHVVRGRYRHAVGWAYLDLARVSDDSDSGLGAVVVILGCLLFAAIGL